MTNDPNAQPDVCPVCGTSSEDMDWLSADTYRCPVCGTQHHIDTLVSLDSFSATRRIDQRLHDADL